MAARRSEAFFAEQGEPLKVQLIEEKTDGQSEVSCYTIKDRDTFVDFCVGPHVPSTGRLKAFKLLNTSNAYWKGDARNQPMQRIYGTAFFSDTELKAHLQRIEEAKKRDHRKLGRELGLFRFHPWAPGEPFWLPKGTTLVHLLANYMREILFPAGNVEVRAPLVFNKALWEKSGHWTHYRENMFLIAVPGRRGTVRPQADELPGAHAAVRQRGAQLSRPAAPHPRADVLHRTEASGVLCGLTRVRAVHSGRLPHLPARGPDRRGSRAAAPACAAVYDDFGLTPEIKLATRPAEFLGEISDVGSTPRRS